MLIQTESKAQGWRAIAVFDGVAGVRPGCAAAMGIPTAEGEQLALLVETDGAADAEQIRARVTERTGIRPHEVHLLAPGTLPRTSSGKPVSRTNPQRGRSAPIGRSFRHCDHG